MTIPKCLQEIAGMKKVQILVGPKKIKFLVHKNVICRASDFFLAAFQGDFQESKQESIHMLEEDPVTFKVFLPWAYAGKLPQSQGTASQRLLYDLYILAEKLCMNDLANRTMDRIKDNHNNNFMIPGAPDRNLKHIAHIYDNTSQNSPLRDFMLSIMVHDLYYAEFKLRHVGQLISRDDLMRIWDIGRDHPEFYQEIFLSLLPVLPERDDAPLRRTRKEMLENLRSDLISDVKCLFHKHFNGEICYVYEQDVEENVDEGSAKRVEEGESSSQQSSSSG